MVTESLIIRGPRTGSLLGSLTRPHPPPESADAFARFGKAIAESRKWPAPYVDERRVWGKGVGDLTEGHEALVPCEARSGRRCRLCSDSLSLRGVGTRLCPAAVQEPLTMSVLTDLGPSAGILAEWTVLARTSLLLLRSQRPRDLPIAFSRSSLFLLSTPVLLSRSKLNTPPRGGHF